MVFIEFVNKIEGSKAKVNFLKQKTKCDMLTIVIIYKSFSLVRKVNIYIFFFH